MTVPTTVSYRVLLTILGSFALALMGCEAPGVGDPCDPESVPPNGFVSSEAYLETSSVQCRTRVCLVYRLEGNTDKILGGDGCVDSTEGCITQEEKDRRVYCTCRCDAPSGSKTSTCECPDGFSCEEIVKSQAAGLGIRGSYCVKKGTIGEDA